MKVLTWSLFISLLSGILTSAHATEPDWREGVRIHSPRTNPHELERETFANAKKQGIHHTLQYPVEISGIFIPWRPFRQYFEEPAKNSVRAALKSLFGDLSKIRSAGDVFKLIGLQRYPETDWEASAELPKQQSGHPMPYLGVTLRKVFDAEALTVSCAVCHTSNLFGKKVFGLTNRFPGANMAFVNGKHILDLISTPLFEKSVNATPAESALYERSRIRSRAVGAKRPSTPGLDTSLAQVALSLARRGQDPYASFDPFFEKHPRKEVLADFVADSKPAVWWSLKYKNRWLSDGSIISGNPISTNILWNEIGRGTDLKELETWMERNVQTIQEITTAVFSTEAPRFTEFFPADSLSLEKAKRGETHFENACAKCHGHYVKNWSLPDANTKPLTQLLQTTEVRYPELTLVKNVGTDPQRWQGMKSIESGLNPLAISKKIGIVIRTQKGYVPPPLVGIWSRFPYFHNNSAPSLCAVLTPSAKRPVTYFAGEALDRDRDFDSECVGYPTGDRTPAAWKKSKRFYDTRRPGLSNSGHDERIFIKDGVEIFTVREKMELIEFLKTL